MPEDYGISACKKQTLPILPDPFKLTIRKVRKDKQLITDPRRIQTAKNHRKNCLHHAAVLLLLQTQEEKGN